MPETTAPILLDDPSLPETESLDNLIKTRGIEIPHDPNEDLSIDTLCLLIMTDRLRHLEAKTMKEIKELKERQDEVRFLHQLLQEINAQTNSKNELDANPELIKKLDKAKAMGIEFKEKDKNGKYQFNKEQRDRLVENIRMVVDDLNVQNDMQLQTVSRLNNERYEMYQMARSILKPLHEDRIQKARAMAGRGG